MHVGKNNPRFIYKIKIEDEYQGIKICDVEKDLGVDSVHCLLTRIFKE